MSIEQTRTCHRCQRENRREDKFCSQCGADLDWLKVDQLFISAGLTIAPFIRELYTILCKSPWLGTN